MQTQLNQGENEIDNTIMSEEALLIKDPINDSTDSVQKKVHRTVYYEITSDKSFKKGQTYSFSINNHVLYTAKFKDDIIYIGEGTDFNINDSQKVVKITRLKNGSNVANINNHEIKIKFVQIGNYNSLNVSFNHGGKQLFWIPRQPKSKIGYNGGYGRAPIQSKKNMMLQNLSHCLSFICREMPKKVFEAECNKSIDPLIVFVIALSHIVGPLSK